MNKRQKKKEYKKLAGSNPPGWMQYRGWLYHAMIGKPWGGRKRTRQQDDIKEFSERMTERRRTNGKTDTAGRGGDDCATL